MSLLGSLIAALELMGGERLVLSSGEVPRIIIREARHDLGLANVLTASTLEALADQALSPEGKRVLTERDFVVEPLPDRLSQLPILVTARRLGRELWLELRCDRSNDISETSVIKDAAQQLQPSERVSGTSSSIRIVRAHTLPEMSGGAAPATAQSESTMTGGRSMSTPATPEPLEGRIEPGSLESWIRAAARHNATALYLRIGDAPMVHVGQRVQPLANRPLDRWVIDAVTAALTSDPGVWRNVSLGEWIREFDDLGPVKCQVVTDDYGAGLVVHLLAQISVSSLRRHIPRQVRRICEDGDGVVVVSASAIDEVMPMVAAVAEEAAQRCGGYTISIEPPGGLGHKITGVFVSPRRLAGTEEEVADAIRRATHEEPNVLAVAMASGLIAEEAIRAARPGCLVIVGAVAATAARALGALTRRVHREREQDFRGSLAASFRYAFGYRALHRTGGGRTIVHDMVAVSADVRARIESGDFAGLEQLQQSGAAGMRSLDAALAEAVDRGEVSLRHAARFALDRREVVALVRQAARRRVRMRRDEAPKDPESGSFRAVAGGSVPPQ